MTTPGPSEPHSDKPRSAGATADAQSANSHSTDAAVGTQSAASHSSEHDPAGRPVGIHGARVAVSEQRTWHVNGVLALLVSIGGLGISVWQFVAGGMAIDAGRPGALHMSIAGVLLVASIIAMTSVTVIGPGDTKVVQLFGRYLGTIRHTGLLMTTPFTSKRKVSVKVRNFETHELKVNDADGNPVMIAAIIVWQVADTAKSVFAVEEYDEFVAVQSESALRHVASTYPYDNTNTAGPSLRGSTELVAEDLAREVAERIAIAGLEVIETRISSLSYASEIAGAMLQRQQAAAIIAAREKIVEGAVSIVGDALQRLEAESMVSLDEERRAAMISNLLVVLTSESRVTPVVNTGSLYT